MIKLQILSSWLFYTILPSLLLFYYYSGTVKTVTKIVDGDTIYFDKRYKCRIYSIDTPESQINHKLIQDISSCKDIPKNRFIEAGLMSKKFIESILSIGDKARVIILDIDKYERNICKIKLLENQKDISELLVQNGYAIPYFKFITSDEYDKWIKLVISAKKSNKGLWKDYADVMNCMMFNENVQNSVSAPDSP